MSLIIEYKLTKGYIPTKNTIKSCDEGCKEFQNVIVETAKITSPKMTWLMWLLTRFYKRKITEEAISYEFYLFPSGGKHEKEMPKL